MSTPYIGEIRMFGGKRPPTGWAFCDGQQLQITAYQDLFNLIATTYGGDGVNTFNLPDLGGRVPVASDFGNKYPLGAMDGVEAVTLSTAQMASHPHFAVGSTNVANQTTPGGNVPGTAPAGQVLAYGTALPYGLLDTSTIAPAGGGLPHTNMQPYACVNFMIALEGVVPFP